MWIEYNPNPLANQTDDCAVRAIAKALDIDWETAYAILCFNGFVMGDMPNQVPVVSSVLRQHGFNRSAIPNTCPDCYTAEDFCTDHPKGVYVLCFSGHIATVVNGNIYDSYDSSRQIPHLYWYRRE